jgi:hypothetical protein
MLDVVIGFGRSRVDLVYYTLTVELGFHLRLIIRDQMRQLGESGGSSVGKGRESDVKSRAPQGGSHHLCWLQTEL